MGMTTPDASASMQPNCNGTFDITTSPIGESGTNVVIGTVALPRMLPAGTTVGVDLEYVTDTNQSSSEAFQLGAATSSITYRVTNLPSTATNVMISVRADATGNGSSLDTGDFVGWYDGSSANPILDDTSAKAVAFTGACTGNINFGLGTRQ